MQARQVSWPNSSQVLADDRYPHDHAFATALKGSDNIVSFTSKRYSDRPLVIQGSGAGGHVTAMGCTVSTPPLGHLRLLRYLSRISSRYTSELRMSEQESAMKMKRRMTSIVKPDAEPPNKSSRRICPVTPKITKNAYRIKTQSAFPVRYDGWLSPQT